jgi:hypothetical protein
MEKDIHGCRISARMRRLKNAAKGQKESTLSGDGADLIVYDLRFRYFDWYAQIDFLGKEVLPVLKE